MKITAREERREPDQGEGYIYVMTGAAGLALMVLGGWLGHAFYSQEENAEWLRRMRERGEVE